MSKREKFLRLSYQVALMDTEEAIGLVVFGALICVVIFACRHRALISCLSAHRERSSNEKKKNSGGLSAVAGVLVVLPISTAKA